MRFSNVGSIMAMITLKTEEGMKKIGQALVKAIQSLIGLKAQNDFLIRSAARKPRSWARDIQAPSSINPEQTTS
jgi:hypothetical protein